MNLSDVLVVLFEDQTSAFRSSFAEALARVLGEVNNRQLIAVNALKKTAKVCQMPKRSDDWWRSSEECGKLAKIQLTFSSGWSFKYFAKYYCKSCFNEMLRPLEELITVIKDGNYDVRLHENYPIHFREYEED